MALAFRDPSSQFSAVVAQVVGLTQKEIVATAKREHAAIMLAPPRPVSFKRHVDGVEAPEEAVKIGGVIVYDYNRLDFIAALALEILREFSPVKEGRYRAAHKIILQTPNEIRITNTVEYSRVIELASRGHHTLRINKGGHVYERSARKLQGMPDVANAAKVKFTFTNVVSHREHRVSRGDARTKANRSSEWPTLIITAL